MRVVELAAELKVPTDAMLTLLRGMGIPVADGKANVGEADVAKVRARIERERRAGKKDVSEAVMSAIEETQSGTRRRRRRRAADEPVEPEPEEEVAEVEDEATAVEGGGEVAAEEEAAPESEEFDEGEVVVEVEVQEVEPVAKVEEVEPVAEVEEEAVPEAPPEEPAVEASAEVQEPEEQPAAAGDEEPKTPAPAAAAEQPSTQEGPESPTRVIRKPVPKPAASAGPGGQVRIQAEGYTSEGKRKKDKKKGKKRQRVDQDAVQDNIQRVMAEIKGGGKKRKKGRGAQAAAREEREEAEAQEREKEAEEAKTVRVNEFLTVAELSELIDVPSTEIVGAAFKNLGMMVTINQRLDFDQIELLLEEFNFKAVREEEYADEPEVAIEVEEDPAKLKPRPPVVTVMGHVDHGKTLLLDHIRKTNVVAGESGGITQHIGAYHVELDDDRTITFLDTPGHAAFTAMRARGADVTDVVILVVAADDSIMPQTIEAISHAKNAGVPIVVAINKMDLPAANADRVRQELLQHGVTAEEFGGDVLSAGVSAKTGDGIDELLEKVLLQAELLELSANPDREAQGIVIEAKLDVGKGPVVSVLVRQGTLRVGDSFICGKFDGRVRALLDERGKTVESVKPGIPVQLLGSPGVPQAGDTFQVMDAVRAQEIATTRQRLEREKQLRIKERGVKLGDFSALLERGEATTLPLIIKGDVDGSVQAVSDALEQLSTDEVHVEVIHRGVGAVNESDVLLAQTAGAVIIGFRVRPDTNSRLLAEREGVDIHAYEVIYEAVDEVRSALEGMLSPERREKILGAAEVREVFKISKVGTVAGCYVTDGIIDRKGEVRVIRDGSVAYTGEIASLKRFKDDVKEVREGFECGVGVANFNDVKVGDVIECFVVEEFARTLATSGAAEKG